MGDTCMIADGVSFFSAVHLPSIASNRLHHKSQQWKIHLPHVFQSFISHYGFAVCNMVIYVFFNIITINDVIIITMLQTNVKTMNRENNNVRKSILPMISEI